MDSTNEAMKIWKAIKPMIDKEIEAKTKSAVRSKKMNVITPPNGETMGVAEPFGEEVFVPYNPVLKSAKKGDSVWVNWYFSNASTMYATAMGDGTFANQASYPVGSIYLSVEKTNPALLFGGEWVQIKDTFLLAAGETYTAGTVGGEAEHTLTIDEMPSHTHPQQGFFQVELISGGADVRTRNGDTDDPVDEENTINAVGDGLAHNNMPPYLAVYVWKRVK